MKKYNKTRRLAILPSYKLEFDRDFVERDNCLQLQTGQIVLDPFGTLAKETYKLGLESELSKRKNYLNFLKKKERFFDEKILDLKNKIKEKEKQKELTVDEQYFLKITKTSLKLITNFREFLNKLPYLNSERQLSEISTEALFKITSRVASVLSDTIISEGIYNTILNELEELDLTSEKPIVKLIEFSKGDTYNPLWGASKSAQEELYADFTSHAKFKNSPFLDLDKDVLFKGIEIVKRTYGNDATIKTLISLINDRVIDGVGAKEILSDFEQMIMNDNSKNTQYNQELLHFFKVAYYDNFVGGFYSNTFKNSAMIRDYLDSTFNNVEMFDLLCPKPGTEPIDFLDCLTYGSKISIALTTGRGKSVDHFIASLILSRIEAAVYCRRGDMTTRNYGNLYLVNEHLYYDFNQLQTFKTKTSYLIDTFSIFQPEL